MMSMTSMTSMTKENIENLRVFDENQEWMVLKNAAEKAGVSYSTARYWVLRNLVPTLPAPRSSGSKYLARPADLRAYDNRELSEPSLLLSGGIAAPAQKKRAGI
jgi:hypothetical protein